MIITSIYASLCGLLLVWLAFQTIKQRRANKVKLGDGGVLTLQGAIRAHGNFTEYMPITLILLLLLEQHGISFWLVHFFGICFIVGRVMHAKGMLQDNLKLRQIGMIITFSVIVALCVTILSLVATQYLGAASVLRPY